MIYRRSSLATTAGQEKIHVTIYHILLRYEFSLDKSRMHFLLWISYIRNHNASIYIAVLCDALDAAVIWTEDIGFVNEDTLFLILSGKFIRRFSD